MENLNKYIGDYRLRKIPSNIDNILVSIENFKRADKMLISLEKMAIIILLSILT